MNKFEKSLDRIKKRVEPSDDWTEDDIEHYKTVWEALEKQVPTRPLEDTKFYGNGICPCCTVLFLDKSTKYCGNCGQALLWEE